MYTLTEGLRFFSTQDWRWCWRCCVVPGEQQEEDKKEEQHWNTETRIIGKQDIVSETANITSDDAIIKVWKV